MTLLLRALATTAVVVSLVESFDDFEYCDSSFLSLVFSFADDDDVFVFLVVSVLFLTFFTEPEETFVFRVFFSSAAFSSRVFFLLTHFVGSCHSCAAMICASSRLPIFFFFVVVVLLLLAARAFTLVVALFELVSLSL